jgi:GNAT superfamily N-acetyltransferase
VGAARDSIPGVTGELWALNLHPIAFGTGLAIPLHRAALDRLAAARHNSVYLWVARDNLRARRFYEREGWTADGKERTEEFGGAPLTEVLYTRGVL